MLRKTSLSSSEGETLIMENWYPFDYSTNIPVIDSLSQRHILGKPIMQTMNNKEKTISASIEELNGIEEITHSLDNMILPSFRKVVSFMNIEGRISEKKVSDEISTYYIWGYSGQYPIAKLENFTSSQAELIEGLISTAVSKSNLDRDRTEDLLVAREHCE